MKYLGLKQLICHVQSTWNVWAPVTGLFPLCSVAQTCKACRPGNSTEMGKTQGKSGIVICSLELVLCHSQVCLF